MVNYRRRPRKSEYPHRAPFNCILDLLPFPSRRNDISQNNVGCEARNTRYSSDDDLLDHCDKMNKNAVSKRSSRKRRRTRSPPPGNNSEVVFVPEIDGNSPKRTKLVVDVVDSAPDEEKVVSKKKQKRKPSLKLKLRVPVPVPVLNNQVITPLPERFLEKIRNMGYAGDPVLVIQKELFATDISKGNQRLSIPVNQVRSRDFLTPEEIEKLNDRDLNWSIKSILIDEFKQRYIPFKRWFMTKSGQYVLNAPWNQVVEDNGLKAGVMIQVWSFRMDAQLYFVLVKL